MQLGDRAQLQPLRMGLAGPGCTALSSCCQPQTVTAHEGSWYYVTQQVSYTSVSTGSMFISAPSKHDA
jgi:hypothetical protein